MSVLSITSIAQSPTWSRLGPSNDNASAVTPVPVSPPSFPSLFPQSRMAHAAFNRPLFATEAQLVTASRSVVREFEAKYGFYESSHPLVKYLQSMADRIADDGGLRPKILVTRQWDDVNACSLPDGTIIVSDRLLHFCEYEEELFFVLGHEYQHAVRQHSQKRFELMEESVRNDNAVTNILKRVGLSRYQEWEADIRSHLDLSKKGINPHGGIIFFRRLAATNDSKDLEHGSPIDRSINLGMTSYLYDMTVLTTVMTPIPRELKAAEVDSSISAYDRLVSIPVSEKGTRYEVDHDRRDIAKVASFVTAMEALSEISRRVSATTDQSPSHLKALTLDEDYAVSRTLVNIIKSHLESQNAGLNVRHKKFLLPMALMLDGGVDLFAMTGDQNPLASVLDTFLENLNSEKDFKELQSLLSSDIFETADLYIQTSIPRFIKSIVITALEGGLFDGKKFHAKRYVAFCLSWVKTLETLNNKRGCGVGFDQSALLCDLILLAKDSLSKGKAGIAEAQALYNEVAQASNFSLSEKDKIKLRSELNLITINHEIEEIVSLLKKGTEIEIIEEKFFHSFQHESPERLIELLSDINDQQVSKGRMLMEKILMSVAQGKRIYSNLPVSEFERHLWSLGRVGDLNLLDISFVTITSFPGGLSAEEYDRLKEAVDPVLDDAHLFNEFVSGYMTPLGLYYRNKDTFMEKVLERLVPVEDSGISLSVENLVEWFEIHHFDITSPRDQEFLYRLSFLIPNVDLSLKLRNRVVREMLRTRSTEDCQKLLFEGRHAATNTSWELKSDFMNHRLITLSQLEALEKSVLQIAEQEAPSKSVGGLLGLEFWVDARKDKRKFFDACLNTERGELFFRKPIYYYFDEDAASGMYFSDYVMNELYAANSVVRQGLIRTLLVGEDGLLRSPKDRQWLINYFFREYVQSDAGDDELVATLRVSIGTLLESADIEMAYLVVAPLIERRFLKKPDKAFDWRYFLKGEMNPDLIGETFDRYKKMPKDFIHLHYLGGIMADHFLPEILLSIESALKPYLETPESQKTKPPLSPLKLILEMASQLGSVGVRLLQLLGQFIDLDPEMERDFSQVYDGQKGQSKLTAYMMLKREMGGAEGVAREFAEIRAPLGGGSLMTPFEAIGTDGVRQVVKCLNPNAEYHLEMTYGLLEKTLTQLAKTKGGGYSLALDALPDIKEWILADISFTGFLEKDRQFHEQQNGYRVESNSYQIKVPRSLGQENRYYKREEFIDGINLTQMSELKKQGHDVGAIVALVRKNYFDQLTRPVVGGKRLIHSDVHPGNFRVTAQNEVAILDRNFFLEFDDKDEAFVKELKETPFLSLGEHLPTMLAHYFDAPHLEEEIRSEIASILMTEVPPQVQVRRLVLALKKMGLKIPLKISLIIKNVISLMHMETAALAA